MCPWKRTSDYAKQCFRSVTTEMTITTGTRRLNKTMCMFQQVINISDLSDYFTGFFFNYVEVNCIVKTQIYYK